MGLVLLVELKVLENFPASILKTVFLGQTITLQSFQLYPWKTANKYKFHYADQVRVHIHTCILLRIYSFKKIPAEEIEFSIKDMIII